MLYAHTPNEDGDWHSLEAHLLEVSELAAKFAEPFGAAELARLVGLWHDLGKANPDFQEYLAVCDRAKRNGKPPPKKSVPHAIWGAAFAYRLLRGQGISRWQDIVIPIQGHHSQLLEPSTGGEQRIAGFLERHPEALPLVVPVEATVRGKLEPTPSSPRLPPIPKLKQELFIRMVFSALIDADRLDTEEHWEPQKREIRGRNVALADLRRALTAHMAQFQDRNTDLNRIRNEVYESSLRAAVQEPGFFRLTVPTGGGKTLSSLAFALEHATRHNLDMVVVALPYTSIIEQTAKVYRDIAGFDHAVLEHHSAIDVPDREAQSELALRQQLATENWDAPIIVTTTVQLFESLFSNRPSKVRKLHRLAKSVIILDEIQAFPPELLLPTLDVLKLLATPTEEGGYGATVVLCTATQPTFESEPLASLMGGTEIREIVPNYAEHFTALKRVTYDWRSEPVSWRALAEELNELRQVLVVLNTRKDAISVLDYLNSDVPLFHLSTLLCGAHRRAVLAEVQERLTAGLPVRLVSTQVVECGVDFDFPVVYRAIGPLDRVVQAAGRCNRNAGPTMGRVIVFSPADGAVPSGPYAVGIAKAELLMQDRDAEELHSPELYRTYFRRLFQDLNTDTQRIQEFRVDLNFPEVAQRYRLIDAPTVPVVMPYGLDWRKRLDALRERPTKRAWQQLQPYVVNLFRYELRRYEGWCEAITDDLYLWHGDYDDLRGIVPPLSDPSDLIV